MKNNALIYLFGYPGVGKNTIAEAIERKTSMVAIQNHLISNAFRHVLSHQKPVQYKEVEHLVKHHTMRAWLNFLDFVEAATPNQGLIFTSVLYQDDPDRVEYFEFIEQWALRQNRALIPVRLTCSIEELQKRVQSPEREGSLKLTDPDIVLKLTNKHQLMTPQTADFLDLDVTHISPEQAADLIIAALNRPA